jgi:hypothetical protein
VAAGWARQRTYGIWGRCSRGCVGASSHMPMRRVGGRGLAAPLPLWG